MENITINELINNVSNYNNNIGDIELINRVFCYAEKMHEGQKRESGEPYIIHPLSVAFILSEMRADADTIAAALLHDTIEDTNATKECLMENFNSDIANLVDGVTKISKINFSTKLEENATNTRKLLSSINDDVRIIIIKLADRLHNMRTLEYKNENKQKENSLETMEIYAPLAYNIGAYRIKSELEDISFRYLKPKDYFDIEQKILKVEKDSESCLQEMLMNISHILMDENIPYEIKKRTKNIYGVYKRLSQGQKISNIHDLFSLKIMVDTIKNCYLALGLIHSTYHPINNKFKDYIALPKTNMYQSLHTTVFGPEDRLVQTQIRTFDMDRIASFGLTAYWDINKGNAKDVMQKDLNEKFQIFKSLAEINRIINDNQDFICQVKRELFTNNIYVYTTKGNIIELPLYSTPIDFAYKVNKEVGNTMVGAVVNDASVPVDYILKNKDRVKIITDQHAVGPNPEWMEKAQTTYAKREIKKAIYQKIKQ